MEEILSIHIGQAGCQIGKSCWELYRVEHNLNFNGKLKDFEDNTSPSVLFNESSKGQWVPRCLFLDTEPLVVDQIRLGTHKNMHHPRNLINGMEDAANCWARGRHVAGKQILEKTEERLRRVVEQCNALHGFMPFQAVGGGTGSSFMALLRERMEDSFFGQKKQTLGICVYPSAKLSTSTVECYNAILGTSDNTLKNNLNIILDNEALYYILSKKLQLVCPTYSDLNQLIAQVVSSTSRSTRFHSTITLSLHELTTNLLPFPRINSIISSFSPLKRKKDGREYSITEMTLEAFHNSNIMTQCLMTRGPLLSSVLNYQGNVSSFEVQEALKNYYFTRQTRDRFCKWVPTNYKIGICYQPPIREEKSIIPQISTSLSLLLNATSVYDCYYRNIKVAETMLRKAGNDKGAFEHWFSESGMEQGFLEKCMDDLWMLGREYAVLGYNFEPIQEREFVFEKPIQTSTLLNWEQEQNVFSEKGTK